MATKTSHSDELLCRRINALLGDVEPLLGVRIMIHDHQGVFRTREARPIIEGRPRHMHPYCLLGRLENPAWDARCRKHCGQDVIERSKRELAPQCTLCWKGVREVVVPMVQQGQCMATLYAGVFRDLKDSGRPWAARLGGEVLAAYESLEVLPPARARQIERILTTLGQGLLHELLQLHTLPEGDLDRRTAIRRFFFRRANQDVTLADLAETMGLSPSRTSHLVRELLGASFQELLIRERIERGKYLLQSSRYGLAEIARRVGLANEYYFSRLFRKVVGEPPGRFRRRSREAQI